MRAFSDRRYIKVNGRPLFLVYKPKDLIQPSRTTDLFRERCIKSGMPEPFLLGIDAHCPNHDCRNFGFDSTVRFEPQLGFLPEFNNDKISFSKFKRNIKNSIMSPKLKIYDYSFARSLMNARNPDYPYYPTIFVGWDNTPRRKENGIIIINSSPDKFENGLFEFVKFIQDKSYEERLIFINAWNEWAEGNHLEPDIKHGLAFLEKIKSIIKS
jgi:hypothetical protein